MTPEQYAARQQLITAAVANFTYQFGKLFTQRALTPTEWLQLLQFLFPEVQLRRQQAAVLAREFYDAQRLSYHPTTRNDVSLEGTDFKVFMQSMEPVRKRMSQADSPSDALTMLTMQVVREVENAGRRQIIHAVQEEKEPGVLRGWARVATGRETCGWCLMLISRGPVYLEANTAGLDLDEESAQRMIAAGEDVSEYMEEWHTGCDCKVIPVFKADDWDNSPYGRAAARAGDLWGDAMAEARIILEEDPDKVHTTGKKRGQAVTLNEEAINALRRRLARGGINTSEFAGLAA